MLRDIGLQVFGFKEIRSKTSDFAQSYNFPAKKTDTTQNDNNGSQSLNNTNQQQSSSNTAQDSTNNQSKGTQQSNSGTQNQSSNQSSNKPRATPIHDQRTITNTLKKFSPKGSNRQKIVTLRDELKKLKVKDNPFAFCFILRSMFEISANIYSKENKIPTAKTKNGKTTKNTLKQQLNAVTRHLTSNNTNQGMIKTLHGANSELSKPTGLLSVTSMNQLVHHPSFSIAPHDIFTLFNNVYPLLEAMN